MARLPVLQRRRSKRQRALDIASTAKAWTTAKVSSVSARVAKMIAGRPVLKRAAVPAAAVAGGVVVWRKAHNGSASNGASADADAGRPLGPVASADSVSPPADAAAEAARSDEVPSS
jgi:hypothetical protein